MIGVISKDSEVKVVQEFFQLFKTPWEFYVPHHNYNFVIITSEEIPFELTAKVVAIYNSKSTSFDRESGVARQSRQQCEWLEWNGVEFPVYGDVSMLRPAGRTFIRCRGRSEIVGFEIDESTRQTFRIAYDLFEEVSFLLSNGQPPENAHIPTLEIHISLLRNCMSNAGIPFVEIPPVPSGYDCMACLTHDVDFMGIREHRFDHTMWGFVYRASVASLIDALKGRMAWSKLLQNWKAVLSLPLVYLGLLNDFWLEFDRYVQIEKGLGSTFFLIPFKNRAGSLDSTAAPTRRAAKYEVTDIKEQVHELVRNKCEIGLHGIDAWHDSQKGHIELDRIREVTRQLEVGVRIHWLYFAERSPKTLEKAGFSYDSTFGYNDAVGFRAGTTQVFRPPTAETLLELSLNIQDTAMFYPSRMNLSEAEALDSCRQLIQIISTFGGALTVNWHTRSLSPERLWGDFYTSLLKEAQTHRVWFGTGEEIVKWFRKRRALRFDRVQFAENRVHLKLTCSAPDAQPSLLVRIYHPQFTCSSDATLPALIPVHSDTPWEGETELEISL